MRRLSLAPLALALALVGCGHERAHEEGVLVPPPRMPRVVGVTGPDATALHRVLDSAHPHGLRVVDVHVRRKRLPRRYRGALMMRIATSSTTLRTTWDAEVVANAFAAATPRAPRLLEATQFGIFGIEGFSSLDTRTLVVRRQRLETRLRTEARRAGALVRELRSVDPAGVTLAATLQVKSPAQFLRANAMELGRSLNRAGLPAHYLGVLDDDGRLVWGLAYADGGGSYFTLRRLDACDNIQHSEIAVPGKKLPPQECRD